MGVLSRGQGADRGREGTERGVSVADAAGMQCWLISGDGDRSAGLRSHRVGCSPICAVLGLGGSAGHSSRLDTNTHTG